MSPALLRPDPAPHHHGAPVPPDATPERIVQKLIDGATLRLTGTWGQGRACLERLDAALPPQSAPFAARQAALERRSERAGRLFAPIEAHRVALEHAPDVGFLSELYPDHGAFSLALPDAIDLSRAWNRYRDGVPFPVLGHVLRPFYGVYAPNRSEHLELFATWLATTDVARGSAVDVGTGTGVLALLLARAGFEQVHATDLNPNAIESLRREVRRHPASITSEVADLLGAAPAPIDLVVFNPPWLPGPVRGPLDQALHYEPSLFTRFFDASHERLAQGGRVAIIFSNIGELVRPDAPHPIRQELLRGRFRQVSLARRRIRPMVEDGAPKRRTKERVEVWELARA